MQESPRGDPQAVSPAVADMVTAGAVDEELVVQGSTRLGTFSSLSYVNYRHLWFGTVFMALGQWIQQVTLGYLIYDMTGSPVLLGLLSTIRALPFLLVSPVAGVIVDQVDRKKLLLVMQSILAVSAFAMGFWVHTGLVQAWHIFLFATITATAWSVNQPLRQTLVNKVVPRKALSNAVALNSMGFNTTKIIGPALGGWLIELFGEADNFFVQGAAYIGVLFSIGRMHVPPTVREPTQNSVWKNLKEGLSYVRVTPAVLALIISGLVPSVIFMPYQTLMPVFQKDVLHAGPEALGLMLAAPGVGAIVATLALATLSSRVRRKGYILLGAMAAMGCCLILLAQATSLPIALLAIVGAGGFQILYAATNMTMLQLLVPDAYLGRVMSIYMINSGFSPAGALFGGIMTQFFGAPLTIALLGGMVVAMAVVMFFRNPEMRRIET
jgi:predicted MFS family arabinose efflux permease